ncbi:MAG: hypothetical protein A2498_02320 [Lentisphaerae bacterium RIFOXYC12_FULL_60_16]|nr:MAG: hypothetical protein A2498_02320 [Lentisphaerae bacterium RIFOXYC12_FULL_60_16]
MHNHTEQLHVGYRAEGLLKNLLSECAPVGRLGSWLRVVSLAGMVVFAAGAAADPATNRVFVDGLAARVNGKAITVSEVLVYVEPVRRQLVRAYSGADLQDRMNKAFLEALDQMIERHLILDAYELQERKLPDWVIDQRISEIVHESFDGDRAALVRALAQDRLTYDQWRNEIQNQIILAAMRQSYVGDMVVVSPRAVSDHYEQHRETYRTSEEVRLRVIELTTGSTPEEVARQRRQAEQLLARLKAGEDFTVLARQQADNPRAAEGGDMGWLPVSHVRTELADAAGPLRPGEISRLIETPDRFYLVKLEGRKASAIQEFPAVRAAIERDLRGQAADRLYQAWIGRLRDQAIIQKFDVQPWA